MHTLSMSAFTYLFIHSYLYYNNIIFYIVAVVLDCNAWTA